MAVTDCQISSLYNFVSSVLLQLSLLPTHLSAACHFIVNLNWIHLYPILLTSPPSLCGRQGSYQGPGISQASTMATTVPYSQPTGNSSSAMGNAQGPAYNMPPSGIQAKC